MNIRNIKDIGSVFFISNLGNFFSFIFIIMMGRLLLPEDFSLISSLLGLAATLAFVYAYLPSILAKYLSKYSNYNIREFYFFNLKKFFKFIFFLSLIIFFFKNLFFEILNFNSSYLFILIIFIFFLNSFINFNDGIILGRQKYLYHSQTVFIQNFFKTFFLVIFFYLFNNLESVLYSVILSVLIVILYQKIKLNKLFRSDKKNLSSNFNFISKDLVAIIMINFISVFMLNIEVIMSRIFLAPDISGMYNAICSLGKISFFLMNSLLPIVIPKTVFLQSKNIHNKQFIFYLIFIAIFISLVLFAFYFFFRDFVIGTVYSQMHVMHSDLILIMNFSYTFLACSSVLLYYNFASIGKKNIFYFFIPLFFLFSVFLIEITAISLALVFMITNALLFLTLIYLILLRQTNKS